ncbi:MAG: hypothetical protein BWK76_11600 [Desulfobulbaceae bacterium A2]|nr:MAG: hypothetical protein BWK76_11600 [Desulfobulbaceae bacterium A2]
MQEKASEGKSSKPPRGGFTNSIGMEFVKVPAGSFMMGRKDDPFSNEGGSDEKPAHQVAISQDFWIGRFEVTQAQWHAVMGKNPSLFKSNSVGEDSHNYPVENVSWEDIQKFIEKLNAKEGKNYRLPTEAEWEYACRSGGKEQKYCGGNEVDAVAWYDGNSGKHTHRVGSKQANGLGIHDMNGNVWEWCSDWYDEKYYAKSPATDPQGPSKGEYRVNRGGSWYNGAGYARAAIRSVIGPGGRNGSLGFRLLAPQSGGPGK